MTKQGQCRTAFSRADLLWGMFSTDSDAEQRTRLAASLGFVTETEEVAEDLTTPEITPRPSTEAEPDFTQTLPEEAAEPAEADNTESSASTSTYYRITDRQITESQADSDSDDLNQPPEWFIQAKPSILDETESRIPACHRVKPLHSELTRWARLEPFLQKALGSLNAGKQVDAERLVQQVANGEFVRHIPRQQHQSWAGSVRLLIDINDANFPYRRDFIHLREKLLQVRGAEGLEIQYVHDNDLGAYVLRYDQHREIIEPWQLPETDTPILVLSDLGMHGGSRRTLYSWLLFGQLLNAQGFRATVLLPVAERDIDSRLLQYFDCFVWNSHSDLKRVRGAYQADKDQRDYAAGIDSLLAYFFAALRVDVGLVRALRQLLPGEPGQQDAGRWQGFDIGHETALWRHAAVVHDGDEWGWRAAAKEDYLTAAGRQIKALSPTKQRQLVGLIGRYHAAYEVDELYFEAMHGLMMLERAAEIPGLVPDEVKLATEAFMADLVKTYAEHPESRLLDGWVQRYLVRHETDSVRRLAGQYWLPLMAFSWLHEEVREGKNSSEFPGYLSAEEKAEISRYINQTKATARYELRQQGQKLVLLNLDEETDAAESDWGHGGKVGYALLTLNLGDSRIFYVHTGKEGKTRNVSLNLAEAREGFGFPATGEHEFQIGREVFTVDVCASPHQKEDWMYAMGVDEHRLYAESCTEAGEVYRWWWWPPEIATITGIIPLGEWRVGIDPFGTPVTRTVTNRGFWYQEPELPLTGSRHGRDRYGLYEDVGTNTVIQRFRWVEPNTFMMGSPESEEGRSINETQHQVNLTQGYWLADTATTENFWFMEHLTRPSSFSTKTGETPIANISWNQIKYFIEQTREKYSWLELRLPTEAEWENACRAGSEGAFNIKGNLSTAKVNYRGTWLHKENTWGTGALRSIQDAKKYLPNKWGLYQMHGNVWEYCQDSTSNSSYFFENIDDYPKKTVTDPVNLEEYDSHRIVRGGSWFYAGIQCRSAARDYIHEESHDSDVGFRLARNHDAKTTRKTKPIKKTKQRPIPTYYHKHTIYPKEFPESWASDWGEDEYGIWMDFTYKGVTQRFRWCEPGKFLMGSPENEIGRGNNELQHNVSFAKGFWIADTTVTQELWSTIMEENPSHFIEKNLPVDNVNWDESQEFIIRLNSLKPELRLVLPTEAQWEYACRSGTTSAFSCGNRLPPEQANFGRKYPGYEDNEQHLAKTTEAKKYQPNHWGIFQMHGNVMEWCNDSYLQYKKIAQG